MSEQTAPHLTFGRALRGEWIKVSSLRSSWWSIGLVAVIGVGMSALVATAIVAVVAALQDNSSSNLEGLQPILAVVSPMQFTMLLAAILGVISVTGEYSTGMIRSTLTAVPRRAWVFASKSVVLAATLAGVSLVVFGLALALVAPILSAGNVPIPFDKPELSILPVLYAIIAMGLYALFGVGIGFLMRNGAGAISVAVGLLFVAPILLSIIANFLPTADSWDWLRNLSDYLPMPLGQYFVNPDTFGLSPVSTWGGLLGLLAWVVAALGGGYLVLAKRDA